MFNEEFYPTPKSLLTTIDNDFSDFFKDLPREKTVLEPSAGKGDIADFLKEKRDSSNYYDRDTYEIDCIEINPECRAALKGKDYYVIYDDFLSFATYKHYDLIYMNPPFSTGDKHLLRAISLQEQYGGKILCILNAETIRNPYTKSRQTLMDKLNQYDATIKYYMDCFSAFDSERKTNVEIAVIAITIPVPERLFNSFIFNKLDEDKQAGKYTLFDEEETQERAELIPDNLSFVDSYVSQYNEELKAGIAMLKEYQAYAQINHLRYDNYNGNSNSDYDRSLLILKVCDKVFDSNSLNTFIEHLRHRYWHSIFYHPKLSDLMTSKMQNELLSNIEKMSRYDVTVHNILELYAEIRANTVKGIEDGIMELFDRFSERHSWIDESSKNIHYYNGWETNKAHKINKKVILPIEVWSCWRFNGRNEWSLRGYQAIHQFADIAKTFDYFAGEEYRHTDGAENIRRALEINFNRNQTANIETKYFYLTFYKKGTCHITFKDEELLERFNLYAGKRRQWLPPDYGRKRYDDLNEEERAVADSFSGGKKGYNTIFENQQKYLINSNELLLLAINNNSQGEEQ